VSQQQRARRAVSALPTCGVEVDMLDSLIPAMKTAVRPRRMAIAAASLAALLALGGCGGGVSVGFGGGGVGVGIGVGFDLTDDGYDGDAPPRVSLVASSPVAAVGETIRLAAAASDDWGIDNVAFYLVRDDGSAELLYADGNPPYEIDTAVPPSALGVVRYFATATDLAGQRRSSADVTVTLVR
jgi:hypothetical protein